MAERELKEQPVEQRETVGEVIHLDRRDIPIIIAHLREEEDELEREERAL